MFINTVIFFLVLCFTFVEDRLIIIANYAFYVFSAAIANFDVISFENTVKFLFFGGSAYLKD